MEETTTEGVLPHLPKNLKLRYYPDPILFKKGEPVVFSQEVQKLASDMLFTMVAHQGIGLAAQQVGHAIQLFVADVEWRDVGGLENSKSYVFINPAIVSRSVEVVQSVEGCLSFPGETQYVNRAKSVVVKALDINGEPFTLEAEGLLSVVIQHEFDHTQGHTFVDAKGYITRQTVRKAVDKRLKRAGLR